MPHATLNVVQHLRPIGALMMLVISSPTLALNPRSNGHTWARSGELSLQVINNLDSVWTPYLQPGATAWDPAANIDFRVIAGSEANSAACSPVYGFVSVCNSNMGKNGMLGITNTYTGSGHTVMVTIRFNDYYFDTAHYNTVPWRTNIVCHGLGHAVGLNHDNENHNDKNTGTCMDYTWDPSGKIKVGNGPLSDEAPGPTDFAALADIYKTPSGTQLPTTIFTMSTDVETVPEPMTWTLLVGGFGVAGIAMRRRTKHGRGSLDLVPGILLLSHG